MKKSLFIITIAIGLWLTYFHFLGPVFFYESNDIYLTSQTNSPEKLLSSILELMPPNEFINCFSEEGKSGFEQVNNSLAWFITQPYMAVIGMSPRIRYAFISLTFDWAFPNLTRTMELAIGELSLTIAYSSLMRSTFIWLVILEFVWGICAIIFFRRKNLKALWEKHKIALSAWGVIHIGIGLAFLNTQPSVLDYMRMYNWPDSMNISDYRQVLLNNYTNNQSDSIAYDPQHKMLYKSNSPESPAFMWIKVSEFSYLYFIPSGHERDLPVNRQDTHITDYGDGFWGVTYYKEENMIWGLSLALLFVWGILFLILYRIIRTVVYSFRANTVQEKLE